MLRTGIANCLASGFYPLPEFIIWDIEPVDLYSPHELDSPGLLLAENNYQTTQVSRFLKLSEQTKNSIPLLIPEAGRIPEHDQEREPGNSCYGKSSNYSLSDLNQPRSLVNTEHKGTDSRECSHQITNQHRNHFVASPVDDAVRDVDPPVFEEDPNARESGRGR